MKANELMIGDWVCYDGDIEYSDPIKIEAMDVSCDFCVTSDRDDVGFNGVIPLPLTAEILEKNGLDKVPELSMVLNRDTMPMYHSPMLHYVHELQHALRLCGLNDLADNFKV